MADEGGLPDKRDGSLKLCQVAPVGRNLTYGYWVWQFIIGRQINEPMEMVAQQYVSDDGNAGLRRHLVQNRCQQFLGPIRLEIFSRWAQTAVINTGALGV